MKKFWTILCAVLLIFALTACGSKKEEIDSTKMQSTIQNMLYQCYYTDADQVAELSSIREEELNAALIEYGFPCDSKVYISVLQSWLDAQEEMGAFVEVGDFEFSSSNGEINATAEAEYEQRGAEMIFTFKENGDLKALSIGAHYTTSEILEKAGLNTIIGMGIVFIVLIFIAIIIWLMGVILGPKKKKSEAPVSAVKETPVAAVENAVTDDTELIAVISAAIAAASGTSSDGFVVRSIKRRSDNKWNRA